VSEVSGHPRRRKRGGRRRKRGGRRRKRGGRRRKRGGRRRKLGDREHGRGCGGLGCWPRRRCRGEPTTPQDPDNSDNDDECSDPEDRHQDDLDTVHDRPPSSRRRCRRRTGDSLRARKSADDRFRVAELGEHQRGARRSEGARKGGHSPICTDRQSGRGKFQSRAVLSRSRACGVNHSLLGD
jgi:hypothetical protein